MSLWRQLTRGFRVLRNRTTADQEVADEISHYLEEATAAFVAEGLSPADAARAARLQLGSTTAVREQVRSYGWENSVGTLFADLRYAVRRLEKKPGFAAASLLTLAFGIASTVAIFSLINSILLKPLAYPHSEQIVALRHTAPGIHIDDMNLSASLYYTYREESRVFQDVGMWQLDSSSVTGLGKPEQVPVLVITHRFLPVLGVSPAIGRGFNASDDDPTSPQVMLLSDGYWKSRFGGNPAVVGRRIMIDGDAREIVGVMPPSFQFMDQPASLLLPLRMHRSDIRLISFCCDGIARLKPGITLSQANADVARMIPMAPAKFAVNPGFSADSWKTSRISPRLRLFKDEIIGNAGKTLWVLMGTVGMLFLIACANVANLLLVRADGRRHELAIRTALGANRARIARELLIESLFLGVCGGVLGLALAFAALRLLAVSGIEHLPRSQDIAIDFSVLAFTFGISLAAGFLFGLIPAIKYTRSDGANAIRSCGDRSLTGSKEGHRSRSILIVVQVALAFILLVGSGLMLRTFQALRHVDPGFSGASQIATFHIAIPESQAESPERVTRMEEDLLRKMEAVAGVSAVGMTSTLPMEGGSNDPVYAEDHATQTQVPPIRRYKYVSPGYFSAVGARLIAGRDLTWSETYQQTPIALISENIARELWHDPRAAIGARIRPTLKDDWREVIGVVTDLHDDGVDQKAPGIVYWPLLAKNFESSPVNVTRSVAFVVRTPRAGSAALLRDLQNAALTVNPNLPLADVKTLESVYDQSLARTSFTLALLGVAASMALFLGVVGICGVISYSVSQRTREIGIRIALGAPLTNITGAFVRNGLLLSALGVACGLAAALALTKTMKSLLYNVSPADPLTYLAVSAGLILAAALASYIPARKATKVNPLDALRAE